MGVITAPVWGSGSGPAWMACVEKPRMEQRYAERAHRRRRARATSQITSSAEVPRPFVRGRWAGARRCSTGLGGGPAVSAAEIVVVLGAVALVLARWAPARARRPVAV